MRKRYVKWLLLGAVPLLLLTIPLSYGWVFGTSFRSIILQPQKTGITTIDFYDVNRHRPLITEIWYPIDSDVPAKPASGLWTRCDEARDAPVSAKKEKYPLILLSHGNGGDRYTISWIAEILSANGYIVASMDHYGNTWNNKIPEYLLRPWERPKDIAFILDQLISHSRFKEKIDAANVGFVGYSLGGATGIWIAGGKIGELSSEEISNLCRQEFGDLISQDILKKTDFSETLKPYEDPRVKAFFLLAPALGNLFDEQSLQSIRSPIYIIASERDRIVPLDTNAKRFAAAIRQAQLKILPGEVDHFVYLNRPSVVGKRFLGRKIWQDPQNIDRKSIHEDIGRTAVSFFKQHLRHKQRISSAAT